MCCQKFLALNPLLNISEKTQWRCSSITRGLKSNFCGDLTNELINMDKYKQCFSVWQS